MPKLKPNYSYSNKDNIGKLVFGYCKSKEHYYPVFGKLEKIEDGLYLVHIGDTEKQWCYGIELYLGPDLKGPFPEGEKQC